MSQPIRGEGGHLVFRIGPKNTKLVEGFEILLPVKFRWIPFSSFRGEVEMSQPIRGQGGHLVFRIGPKNTNLVEGVEILLSVNFRWIPFSGFRGEVENVEDYAGRRTDRRRMDGRCAMTIAHSSLRLQWAKYYMPRNFIPGAMKHFKQRLHAIRTFESTSFRPCAKYNKSFSVKWAHTFENISISKTLWLRR